MEQAWVTFSQSGATNHLFVRLAFHCIFSCRDTEHTWQDRLLTLRAAKRSSDLYFKLLVILLLMCTSVSAYNAGAVSSELRLKTPVCFHFIKCDTNNPEYTQMNITYSLFALSPAAGKQDMEVFVPVHVLEHIAHTGCCSFDHSGRPKVQRPALFSCLA